MPTYSLPLSPGPPVDHGRYDEEQEQQEPEQRVILDRGGGGLCSLARLGLREDVHENLLDDRAVLDQGDLDPAGYRARDVHVPVLVRYQREALSRRRCYHCGAVVLRGAGPAFLRHQAGGISADDDTGWAGDVVLDALV